MWRLWTRGWGPRAWLFWFREEGFPMWCAWRISRHIALWVFVRVVSASGRNPSDITYESAYRAWENGEGR